MLVQISTTLKNSKHLSMILNILRFTLVGLLLCLVNGILSFEFLTSLVVQGKDINGASIGCIPFSAFVFTLFNVVLYTLIKRNTWLKINRVALVLILLSFLPAMPLRLYDLIMVIVMACLCTVAFDYIIRIYPKTWSTKSVLIYILTLISILSLIWSLQ